MLLDQIFDKYADRLPEPPKPKGVYKPMIVTGNMAFVSGHGPVNPPGSDNELICGRIGIAVSQEYGKDAALQTGLAILATLRAHLGSLSKVKRVIKVLGMVNADADFENHPYVINGCSELFEEVWGNENGVGSRSAVGFGSLPQNITVEIEAQFELY
ncbi:RidA family protein [Jiulongibacter sediminis]|uniref:Endoribonuclease L-PSP n=1 Tax=Jiulongibacter sediminis TaxID=1605367 RepID=A0A0P7BVW5_9BACT|nr:RidA family protein [Jiulongibacter sediminis]KPM49096.1 endoribonuclease L-PSP [Jiulongibacter sediminis]TBX26154.1 endoribonuclease L-PSP [Jiulongibacter sediminis]